MNSCPCARSPRTGGAPHGRATESEGSSPLYVGKDGRWIGQRLVSFPFPPAAPARPLWHPCSKTHRLASRLPLSTEETYLGDSGSRVVVLYQLRKVPFIALELLDSRERRGAAAAKLIRSQIAKIASRQRRGEPHADIGR